MATGWCGSPGRWSCPCELPNLNILYDHLQRQGSLVRLDELAPLRLISSDVDRLGRPSSAEPESR